MTARTPSDGDVENSPSSTTQSRWTSLIGVILMLAGAVFLGRVLLRSTHDLAALSWQPSPVALLASLGLLSLCLACAPLMWRQLLRDFHHRVGYRDAFAIHYVAALAKYLPGSVWGVVGMAHYARRLDLPARTTVYATLMEHAVVSGGSVLVFAASLWLWPRTELRYQLGAATVWLIGGLVVLSPLPSRMVSFIGQRWLRLTITPRFTRRGLLLALLYYFASVPLFAGGYYFLLQSFYPTPFRSVLIFTGLYAVSWLAGFVAIFAPGGLGVRDGVQAYLLSWFVPPAVAVTIALVQRVWLTVGDLLSGLLSLWLLRRTR